MTVFNAGITSVCSLVAALRQLLIKNISSHEDTDRDTERGETQKHEQRTDSRQRPEDGAAVENGSEKPERDDTRRQNPPELPSADTGFFETSEECGM